MAGWPAVTVAELDETLGVKSLPVPESATLCGLPGALLEMVMLPLREPPAIGAKVTLIVQLAAAATLVLHVLVCAKSAGFVPPTVILVIVSGALPVFVKVTRWAALLVPTFWVLKLRLVGDRVAAGTG